MSGHVRLRDYIILWSSSHTHLSPMKLTVYACLWLSHCTYVFATMFLSCLRPTQASLLGL